MTKTAFLQCAFYSNVLELRCTMNVILPQEVGEKRGDTAPVSKRRHPTLWLLHGLSDDHSGWMRRTSIERYVENLGLAVVMPAVDRSFYVDMHHGNRYGTFMREELPNIARSIFPLSGKREDNFIAGLSMGGYGAFLHALSEPEKYAAAASLSGALDLACRDLEDEERISRREREMIFGDLSEFKGGGFDLMTLAERAARSGKELPALYQCCGTEDFLYQENRNFLRHARNLGLDLTYEEGPGEHTWDYWDAMIQKVLDWLPLPEA